MTTRQANKMFEVQERGLWPLRLLSLAIAISFWLIFSYSGREQLRRELAFDVPVTYTIPQGLVVLNPTTRVSVRLSGSESIMAGLTPFQVGVSANVVPETGLQEILLGADGVSRPEGVDFVSITPSRLSLQVDEEIEKQLRVNIDPGGSEVSAGAVWLQEETTTTPPYLIFRGPRSLLEDRNDVFAHIDLEGHLTSFEQRVAIDPIHELVQPVGPSIVVVQIVIREPELTSDANSS